MRAIVFSGDHSRHLFVTREVLKFFDEVLVVVMSREEVLPSPPVGISAHDAKLFAEHFENRQRIELATYGDLAAEDVFSGCEIAYITREELNTARMAKRVENFNADFCFIFGVNLILDPVIDVLPRDKINLHLGLSPWYKGGATLYWPFFHLKPQFAGVTFHQITKEADAGEIVHQCVPPLLEGDTIHDVGARCVVKARDDLERLLTHWKHNRGFSGERQKTSGRNWIGIDFHPAQLRVIYDLFGDRIVDKYLAGDLGDRKPKLFSCID